MHCDPRFGATARFLYVAVLTLLSCVALWGSRHSFEISILLHCLPWTLLPDTFVPEFLRFSTNPKSFPDSENSSRYKTLSRDQWKPVRLLVRKAKQQTHGRITSPEQNDLSACEKSATKSHLNVSSAI